MVDPLYSTYFMMRKDWTISSFSLLGFPCACWSRQREGAGRPRNLGPGLGVFQRSWDDSLVVRALGGLHTICRVAAYFDCDSILDDVLNVLLPIGTDYVMNAIVTDNSTEESGIRGESYHNVLDGDDFMLLINDIRRQNE